MDTNSIRHDESRISMPLQYFDDDDPPEVDQPTIIRPKQACSRNVDSANSSVDACNATHEEGDANPTITRTFDASHGDVANPINSDSRPQCERRKPTYLTDYILNGVQTNTNTSLTSGTPYSISHFIAYDKFSLTHRSFLAAISTKDEPKSFFEAIQDPKWRQAMKAEIDALEKNNTWTLETLPPDKRPIGCKWVYKIKYNADGKIERYKACLVAKGFTQVEGIDYHDTFALVAKLVTVRCLLAIAAARNWELHQLDVHNAFLHGDLNEEVYMQLPPGYGNKGEQRVCRLRKSLYGLKQASRNWFAKFASALKLFGFQQSMSDYSLFTYRRENNFLAVLVYVDDLIIAGNNSSLCQKLKEFLHIMFHIKDLGKLKYFLGIEVARHPFGIFLCQRKYTLDILTEAGMLGTKSCPFPMEQKLKLTPSTGSSLSDPMQYRRLVGKLIYLTITRPEISFAVHTLSQFMQAPRQPHLDAAMRVLRYLKSSPGQGIFLSSSSCLQLSAYCDSDWASCPTTRRFTTGYLTLLGNSPISWKTKKQSTVSRSSTEAEYRAMASTVSELLWLKGLLKTLGVDTSQPMQFHCDNQAAIHIATNPVFHERTKHIELDCHFIRHWIQVGLIKTSHVRSNLQVVDIFTKALGGDQFQFLLRKLGITDLHAPTWRGGVRDIH
ncbi:hypothetical protein SLEP1_g36366 [Rubroshorea leprosula]|uniref:Reverse transcriptase Ty1/copia-type domain-containing protein n=1 Tax=Rubroshorea leprosula TaxID=152421 RepID=A0AAV5KRK5_9ROSI|nr:hypothetical protein SLEP1_g36366 [Rubroshorea leprosula]